MYGGERGLVAGRCSRGRRPGCAARARSLKVGPFGLVEACRAVATRPGHCGRGDSAGEVLPLSNPARSSRCVDPCKQLGDLLAAGRPLDPAVATAVRRGDGRLVRRQARQRETRKNS